MRSDDNNDGPIPHPNTASKIVKMRSYSQLQAHEIIVIPPDDPVLPSPAFSKVAHRLTASNSAPTAPDARPRSPVELLVVSAKPQSPHVMEPGTTSSSSEDEDAGQVLPPALPASPRIPTTPAHQKLIVVTPIAPIAPLPPSPSPSQKTPAAAATTTITATTAAVAPAHSSGSPTDSVEVNTPYDVPPAYESLGLSDHDKSVRRGRASGLGASLLSPTSPQTSPLSKGDNSLSRGGDVLVVDSMAPAIQPSKTVCAGTDPISAAHDQSQSDLTTQVEALKAQLNRLQRQCDQNTGLMQLKDWVTTLWMKRTRKWEARAAELEQDRDQLREELKHTKQRKVFWRRTATERLTASHQWVDLCQEQTKEIVDLKQRSVVQQGKIEMLEVLLDEAGSVASTASTELARSVDGLEDPEDADEQVDMQPQNPSAAHPSFSTRTSYLSTISAVSSGSGSSAAESYTNDFDVEDDDYPSPPSATPPSCSSPPPLAPAESDPEPAPTHSKEELENLLAELRAGQEEFEVHLAKYAADRKALKEGWDELAEAQDRLQDEYEDFDASVRASDEAVARRTAAHERRANMLIDQEMELDLLKRRYVDKVRNYERISIDLKRREDHFFSRTDHVHLLAEDVEQSRMQNEATRCVLREEWNEVEYAWMAVWRRQNRLVKAAQLCQCPCVCGNRGDVESWNDDEVPALLLGEAGRENERANKVRAIVEEEIWKRRDEERNEGRRLRCVRDCECPECMPEDVEVSANVKTGRNWD